MASSDGEEQNSAILEVTSEAKRISSSCSKMDGSCDDSNDSSITETNGLVQSPSAESISTFQDLERMSELVLDSTQDIVSRVDNPQKVVESWGTYVAFRLRTRCKRWDDEEKEYIVRRRYNDFKALRDRLVCNSLQVVPPLPGRHTLLGQLDRYSKDFVLQRMALLNIFIRRLTTHSILSHNEDLKIFLTASQSELSNHFKSKASYLSSISDSLYSLASSNGSGLPSSAQCRVRDPEFTSVSDYMTSLRSKLDTLATISSRINKERSDITSEMTSVRPILESWSQIERFNRGTLKRSGDDGDKAMLAKNDGALDMSRKDANRQLTLGEILKRMVKPYHVNVSEQTKMVAEFPYALGNPIQEYLLYVDAVRSKLREREGLQAGLEAAQDKLAKLPLGLPASRDVEECHDRLQCASEALRSDLQGWQRQKKTDVKLLLLEMAKRHILFYEKSLNAWEAVLPITTTANSKKSAAMGGVGTDSKPAMGNGDVELLRQVASALAPELLEEDNTEPSKDSSDWENVENAAAV